mmetsp:Transcript_139172/g.444707  ORF Transcript_139172/g.444707 Transcript_139172/m.444707 type:complete len:374 (+) Transcript_139172:1204-2325(+)
MASNAMAVTGASPANLATSAAGVRLKTSNNLYTSLNWMLSASPMASSSTNWRNTSRASSHPAHFASVPAEGSTTTAFQRASSMVGPASSSTASCDRGGPSFATSAPSACAQFSTSFRRASGSTVGPASSSTDSSDRGRSSFSPLAHPASEPLSPTFPLASGSNIGPLSSTTGSCDRGAPSAPTSATSSASAPFSKAFASTLGSTICPASSSGAFCDRRSSSASNLASSFAWPSSKSLPSTSYLAQFAPSFPVSSSTLCSSGSPFNLASSVPAPSSARTLNSDTTLWVTVASVGKRSVASTVGNELFCGVPFGALLPVVWPAARASPSSTLPAGPTALGTKPPSASSSRSKSKNSAMAPPRPRCRRPRSVEHHR